MKNYRGYEIKKCETMDAGKRSYCEIWKDGNMWGFTSDAIDAEIMIDRMIEKAERL